MVESINLDNWFPDYQTMQEIDQYLVSEWGIEYFLSYNQFGDKYQRVGRKGWSGFERLCKKKNEKLVTDAMANFDIHALHVSQWRRSYVLDLVALTYEWMQRKPIAGKVIDIGCQNGILLKFVAKKFSNQFFGIDPSSKAISAAKEQLSGIENVSLATNSLPLTLNEKFDLAICLDVLHHLDDKDQFAAVKSILELLDSGGSAIIATQTFEDADWWDAIQPALNETGCELVAAGRVGGAIRGGSDEVPADWSSSGVGIFQMTGRSAATTDAEGLRQKFDLYWGNFFAPYANLPTILWGEKTLGFEAAKRRKASS